MLAVFTSRGQRFRFTFFRAKVTVEGVGRSPLPTGDWHKAGLEISIIEQASLCPTPKVMKLTNSMISKKKSRR